MFTPATFDPANRLSNMAKEYRNYGFTIPPLDRIVYNKLKDLTTTQHMSQNQIISIAIAYLHHSLITDTGSDLKPVLVQIINECQKEIGITRT